MIGLAEAQARLLALLTPLSSREEIAPMSAVAGRIVVQPVLALRTQPARDLSAMDGYAVRGSGPWVQIGESAAGRAFEGALADGQCVRIFTRAVVPDGGEAVIMQEDVAVLDGRITLTADRVVVPGKHIRPHGSDFAEGDAVIPAGAVLTPARIALAIAAGHGHLPVSRPVRVALLSTGDELRPAGEPCAADQIPASNGPMLAAMLTQPGVIIDDFGIVPDRMDALADVLDRAEGADIILTLGGASVGDHDLVRPALLAAGAEIDFWKVAMKPGKPLMAGRLGGSIVLGLPGNPVSAYVTAILFAVPLVKALMGAKAPLPEPIPMSAGTPLPANGPRTDHLRAVISNGQVVPVGVNDSAALLALSKAQALIVRPAGADAVAKGQTVPVLILPRLVP